MILKIDTHKKDVGCQAYNEWFIFGEVERINYKYWPHVTEYGIGHYGFDKTLFCLNPDGEEDVTKETLHLAIKFEDPKKEEYNILLQGCTCYLCNNDGKTIDKLLS